MLGRLVATAGCVFMGLAGLSAPEYQEVVVEPLVTLTALPATTTTVPPSTTTTVPEPVYRHGDCSWLPEMALRAGWEEKHLPQLTQIILRESGCCPNRRGGDRVDADCNLVKVAEWHHRSDTGLLQINGVHWKQDHPQYHGLVCKQMGICEQEPLLDAYTNLVAGKLLYDVAGWSPWKPRTGN